MTSKAKRSRGRAPLAEGEETYRVYFKANATRCDGLAAAALRRGLTRKERGSDYLVADMSAIARVAVDLLLELEALQVEGELDFVHDAPADHVQPRLIEALRKALAQQRLTKKRPKS